MNFAKMQAEYAAIRHLNTEKNEITETEIKLKIYRAVGMVVIDGLQAPCLNPSDEEISSAVRVRLRAFLVYIYPFLFIFVT